MTPIMVPVSPGELIDKLTILDIKLARIDDPDKRANVQREHDLLETVLREKLPDSAALAALRADLGTINAELWEIEDDIRACEAAGDFSGQFIALARAVYRTNDRRAAVKKRINLLLGSDLVEEKSYVDPDGGA